MQTNKNANQFYFQIIFFSFLYNFFFVYTFCFFSIKTTYITRFSIQWMDFCVQNYLNYRFWVLVISCLYWKKLIYCVFCPNFFRNKSFAIHFFFWYTSWILDSKFLLIFLSNGDFFSKKELKYNKWCSSVRKNGWKKNQEKQFAPKRLDNNNNNTNT